MKIILFFKGIAIDDEGIRKAQKKQSSDLATAIAVVQGSVSQLSMEGNICSISEEIQRDQAKAIEEKTKAMEVKIGQKMPDGFVYIGLSPDKNTPLYVASSDAAQSHDFATARSFVAYKSEMTGVPCRLPTIDELKLMFNQRALLGNFCTTETENLSFYWSSSKNFLGYRLCLNFNDAQAHRVDINTLMSVRLVRD